MRHSGLLYHILYRNSAGKTNTSFTETQNYSYILKQIDEELFKV